MKFDRTITAALSALWLSGCGGGTATPQRQAVATVAASEQALTAAGRAILVCYGVPSCNRIAPRQKIRAAYDAAYDAVTAAQTVADAGGSPDLTAMTAAMTTLQGIVAQLPKAS